MRCKIYSKIESRKKNKKIPKLDFLSKHVGRQKATSIMPKVKVGEFFKNQKMSTNKKWGLICPNPIWLYFASYCPLRFES